MKEFEMNAWLDSSQEHYIDKFVLCHCAHIRETQILRTFQSAQGAEQEKLGWCLIQSIRMTVQLLLHSVSTTAIGAGHVPLHLEPIRFCTDVICTIALSHQSATQIFNPYIERILCLSCREASHAS